MPLSTEQKIFLVATFFANQQSLVVTLRHFRQEYGRQRLPRSTLQGIIAKFQRFGTVLDRHKGNSGRHRTGRTGENRTRIEELIRVGTPTSLRILAREVGDISYVTVRAILKFDIKARPYHLELLHHLTPADFPRRVDCCRQILDFVQEEDLPFFFMSDEVRFYLDGHVCRHNSIIWATQQNRPEHHFTEHELNAPSLILWCAISGNFLIGPFFLDQRVNGDVYLELLENDFLPDVQAQLGNDIARVIFQQDGATPHRRHDVVQWINEHFPRRSIGMGLHVPWPARSPDLTSCDFFLWGFIKELVYVHRPFDNLDQMRQTIEHVFEELRTQGDFQPMLNRVARAVLSRMRHCIANGGRQVESYRF